MEGLKGQDVVAIQRQKKRTEDPKEFKDSGVFILSFNTTQIPQYIYAGYRRLKVSSYIPNPLRCLKCLQYGHLVKDCVNDELCAKCAGKRHDGVPCVLGITCINCIRANRPATEVSHSATSRDCPIFLEEFEIQRIKTTERVSMVEARKRFKVRPRPISLTGTFADAVQKKPCGCACSCNKSTTTRNLTTPRNTYNPGPSGLKPTPLSSTFSQPIKEQNTKQHTNQ